MIPSKEKKTLYVLYFPLANEKSFGDIIHCGNPRYKIN
jgi:hypothetical protein